MARALPTDRHIDALFERIAGYRGDQTAAVLKVAVTRARRAMSNVADGYPSTSIPGGTGRAELTSVESAAEARITGSRRDPLDEHVRRCLAHLETVVNELDLLTSAVAGLANIAFDTDTLNERRCHPCSQAGIDHGHDLKRVRVGDVSFDVCQWAYKFFLDVGAMPSVKQCREHDERGYTRRRVDPTQLVPMVS